MLGKLVKHELKATYKIMLLLDIIVLGLGIIGHFILQSAFFENESLSILQASMLIIYILGVFAAFLLTTIYMVVRYYKNLYTTEGYLTFTLPVSTASIINAKVISGFLWRILNTVLTVLSVFILCGSALFSAANFTVDNVSMALEQFTELTGITAGYMIGMLVLLLIISSLYSVLIYYFCITVGQLWQKHKIIGAVLAYAGTYVVLEIVVMITMFTSFSTMGILTAATPAEVEMVSFYKNLMLAMGLESLVFCIVFYLGCILVTKKKINLD